MKPIIFTCLILLLFFQGQGQQAISENEFVAPRAYNELEDQFSRQALSAVAKEDFTVRGKQKVQDFFDLLGFISNSEYDPELRQAGVSSALHLFADPEVAVLLPSFNEKSSPKSVPLSRFLAYSQTSEALPFEWQLLEVREKGQWERENKAEYIQVLTFELSETGNPSRKAKGEIALILTQRTKSFGDETQYIWEVLLGKIQ